MNKKRVVIIIGSGFSSALTSGNQPILGNSPLPTLTELSDSLVSHMNNLVSGSTSIPFEDEIIKTSIALLRENIARPKPERYNFEELISLLSIQSALARSSKLSMLTNLPGSNPQILQCILYCLSDFFLTHLSHNSLTKANRNFFYKVNDQKRAIAMKEGIWDIVDKFEVTFVTFNWDGIIESFLDHWLGEDKGYRYLVELSHAIPLVMPEHVYSRKDNRDLSRLPRLPVIIKPHGSIHFFQLREELRGLMGGPTLAAVHPRLDIGFNQKTMQRDIPDIQFWEFADPMPVVIPPVTSKENYFDNNYFQAMLRLMIDSIQKAEHVLIIGFSLPPSDLYISAAFKAIDWTNKKLGLVFKSNSTDQTHNHWKRISSNSIEIVCGNGIPTDSVDNIKNFWGSIGQFLS